MTRGSNRHEADEKGDALYIGENSEGEHCKKEEAGAERRIAEEEEMSGESGFAFSVRRRGWI